MERSPCPVCAAPEGVPLGAKQGQDYLRCPRCALIYARVLPTPEMYAASYHHYGRRRKSVLWKSIKLAPLVLGTRLRGRGQGRDGPLRFLDVGSNTGYNTEAVRRLGCEAHGIETNALTLERARQAYPSCTFHGGTIEALAEEGLCFDLIYCSEVIEHVPDPHGFVAALARLSAPGAVLHLTTPDSGHFRVPLAVLEWSEVIPIQHLRLYDRRNLGDLLAAHGFVVRFASPMLKTTQRLYCTRRP